MTELGTDHAIESLATRVLNGTLPKSEWTHAAHFALALWLLRHMPELAKPDAMREIIIALNYAHGTPNTESEGYHHTITIASLRAARSMMVDAGADPEVTRVLARLLDSVFARPEWIFAYWSPDLLFSAAARREWIEPDIQPLPF